MSFKTDVLARAAVLTLTFVFSIIGVSFPFLAARCRSIDITSSCCFDLLQCFAVGLLCGATILHIYDDALRDLSALTEFPVPGCAMLVGCFMMLALNRVITFVASRQNSLLSQSPSIDQGMGNLQIEGASPPQPGQRTPGSGHRTPLATHSRAMSEASSGRFHGHAHQRLGRQVSAAAQSAGGHLIKALLLEFAIAVHFVLIGMGMGVVGEESLMSLGVAICFHQLFEGIAIGNHGLHSGMVGHQRTFMIVLFSISCPLGGVLGIAIASHLDTSSDQARWTLGALNAIAAGTLLEIGCVDLLPELFSHKPGTGEQISLNLESGRLMALALGALVMALLARI